MSGLKKFSSIQESNPLFSPQFPNNLLNLNENSIHRGDSIISQYPQYPDLFYLNEPPSSQRNINLLKEMQGKNKPDLLIDIDTIQNENFFDPLLNLSSIMHNQNLLNAFNSKVPSPFYSPNLIKGQSAKVTSIDKKKNFK